MTTSPFLDRTFLVTGSTAGIGLGIASALLDRGANVVINGRDVARVRTLEDQFGPHCAGVPGSVDDQVVVDVCIEQAFSRFGALAGVVNNVGMNGFFGLLAEVPVRRWNRTLAVNLTAPLCIVQAALARGFGMAQPGVVVNISTIGAHRPERNLGAYCVSKAALEMLTQVLAVELGPRVRVNALAPGLVATETSRVLWSGGRGERAAEARPLRRLGEVADVVEAALFLLSDASGWMTGATLVLDGGASVLSGTAAGPPAKAPSPPGPVPEEETA